MTFSKEILRKSIHASGVIVLVTELFWPTLTIAGLGLLAVLYTALIFFETLVGSRIPGFSKLTHFLKREERIDWAPVYLALGIAFSLFFFERFVARCAILQVCLADAAACLVGKYFGKTKLPWGKKTYLGSLTYFVTALLVQLPIFYSSSTRSLGLLFLMSSLGTLIEALPWRSLDNLVIPLIVGLSGQLYLKFLS